MFRRVSRGSIALAFSYGCVAVVLTASAGSVLGACGGDDSEEPKVALLDPAVKQYGKTFEQWAAAWVVYVNSFHPPDCVNPLVDPTGDSCAVDQDPKSPVFFLAGAFGGVAKRECTVPAGKALFIPLITVTGDNAGVAEDQLYSDDDLRMYVQNVSDNFDAKRLWLRVDGEEIKGLAKGNIRSAKYTVEFDKDSNRYLCDEVEGVEGKFPGYLGGTWAMLKPLSKGVHTIEYGVERGPDPISGDSSQAEFSLKISYELEVE